MPLQLRVIQGNILDVDVQVIVTATNRYGITGVPSQGLSGWAAGKSKRCPDPFRGGWRSPVREASIVKRISSSGKFTIEHSNIEN